MINFIPLLIFVPYCSVYALQSNDFQRQKSFLSCKYDADCLENSFCIGNDDVNLGKCKCKDNYILVDRNRTYYECLLTAEGIGSPCTKDIQCQIHLGSLAVCNVQNVCQCSQESHLAEDKMCHKTVGLGDWCTSNYNCLLGDGTNAFCVSGRCVCNINQHPTEDRKNCIKSVPLGKVCENSESCFHTFASCFNGVCRCITGYVESDDNSICLYAAARVGEKCEESIQCSVYLKDAYCKNGTCICNSAHHNYGNECVPSARLGERCSNNKECIWTEDLQNSVKCEEGTCTCIAGISDKDSYGCIVVPAGVSCTQPLTMLLLLLVGIVYWCCNS